jgi:type 2 lantibiotic biosynthesis protein LanM
VRTLAREEHGWSEFIEQRGTDDGGCARFFRRAGGWLALFHCFAAADMHQENMIASGEHPVPIDLETIFHAAADRGISSPEEQAAAAAREILSNSVMTVGLLPAYGRSPLNNVFAIGGLTADWTSKTVIDWTDVNTDEMRPVKARQAGAGSPNLPHVDGVAARFSGYTEDFISGFSDYAKFLMRVSRDDNFGGLFDGFAGASVRRVVRPTRFYAMLLQRLRNHQSMDDGITWSAQADFIARLADWEKDDDPMWPLLRAERRALLALNVPHFVSPSDGNEIRDASGISVRVGPTSGLERAKSRVQKLDDREIAWQVEVIRENTNSRLPAARQALADAGAVPGKDAFIAEADKAAAEISRHAIRRGPAAAWIGLDWLGDSDMAQLTNLGPDIYNGTSGIALFLAAHAAVTGTDKSADLALAGVAYLRRQIRSRNAARFARSLGLGAGTGLGGIVYALTAMAAILRDDALRADAQTAAALVTDDLIAADKQLDVIGGAAGAILALLRLYRVGGAETVLRRAEKCGEHLLAQSRPGAQGQRSFLGQGVGTRPLNGMSHGAAGFAYALAALAAASGRDDFASAASECIAFENSSYDVARKNWPDLRGGGEPSWPCQWCHGAPGIGLARIATGRRGTISAKSMRADIEGAAAAVERAWPGNVDTLCCGTLGSVEFLCEAADALGRNDLRDLAARRLASVMQAASTSGDYRWNSGGRQFNLGLFRGLAGVGYTALRQADGTLPNVLVWD